MIQHVGRRSQRTTRLVVACVVVLTLVFALTACGGGANPGDNEGATQGPPAGNTSSDTRGSAEIDPSNLFNNVLVAESLEDLVNRFKVLAYTWEGSGEGMDEKPFSIRYEYKGQTTLNGQAVDEIALAVGNGSDTQEMGFWVDSSGQTVQLRLDDQTVQGDMIAMMSQSMLTFVLLPFQMVDTQGFTEAWTDKSSPWAFTDHQQRSDTVAGHDVTVHTLTGTETVHNTSFTWEVTDFGDFQVFTGWSTEAEGQKAELHLTLKELEMR